MLSGFQSDLPAPDDLVNNCSWLLPDPEVREELWVLAAQFSPFLHDGWVGCLSCEADCLLASHLELLVLRKSGSGGGGVVAVVVVAVV